MTSKMPVWKIGLLGRCPRCAEGHLFAGFLRLRKECEVCGLDYGFADPADGPAFFVMMLGCIPVAVFGFWLEIVYSPPLWIHLIVTLPLVFITCVPLLRPVKGWMVVHQYRSKAEELRSQDRIH